MKEYNVKLIPPTRCTTDKHAPSDDHPLLQVAAYCRVSTGDENQQSSYETQKSYYTELINNTPRWTLAGIYADEAISGTSRAKRKQFNQMIEDSKSGKIDFIITKSISRFARNTVDTLDCVRLLRQLTPPVGIYFEKENINTLDATGELFLTILSALAQEESRSISDNIRWAIQKKFQRGEPIINLNRFLGYDQGPDGEWLINPAQAEIIQYIFQQFISGKSANKIAKELNHAEKKTLQGCIWRADAILRILRNEKYIGDCECQKTITKDYLTHRSSKNNGEAPRYYVNNHHTGIIDRLIWNKAQALLADSHTQTDHRCGPKASVFYNLICGEENETGICLQKYHRFIYNNITRGDPIHGRCRLSYPVWRCRNKLCLSSTIYEYALEQSFMEMLYKLKRDYATHGKSSRITMLFQNICPDNFSKSESDVIRANYDFFLHCLLALPDTNKAGIKLNICGLDTVNSHSHNMTLHSGEDDSQTLYDAPDYLSFDACIYKAFIQKGIVCGDEITYTTNFGIKLSSHGNSRTLDDFLGFRKVNDDGDLSLVAQRWQIPGIRLHSLQE